MKWLSLRTAVPSTSRITSLARSPAVAAGVPAVQLGYSGGPDLTVEGLLKMPLSELRAAHEAWLPTYMNSAA